METESASVHRRLLLTCAGGISATLLSLMAMAELLASSRILDSNGMDANVKRKCQTKPMDGEGNETESNDSDNDLGEDQDVLENGEEEEGKNAPTKDGANGGDAGNSNDNDDGGSDNTGDGGDDEDNDNNDGGSDNNDEDNDEEEDADEEDADAEEDNFEGEEDEETLPPPKKRKK